MRMLIWKSSWYAETLYRTRSSNHFYIDTSLGAVAGASPLYALLSVLHLVAGLLCLVSPLLVRPRLAPVLLARHA